jgi:hypothetical protein
MTEGEITFHLREIHANWAPPRITSTTAAELERQGLIMFSDDRLEIRLTPEGVRRKNAGRMTSTPNGQTRPRQRPRRDTRARRSSTRARPLV